MAFSVGTLDPNRFGNLADHKATFLAQFLNRIFLRGLRTSLYLNEKQRSSTFHSYTPTLLAGIMQ